jgi:hypothetical protein
MPPFPDALSANFNEPQTDDTTSAPPMQIPSSGQAQAPTVGQSLAQALKKRKAAGLINPSTKQPAALKAAIARARRAHQGGDKFGG